MSGKVDEVGTRLPPRLPLAPGDSLGSYEILAPLGTGGCGIVYKARHRVLQKVVALKMLAGGVGNDLRRIARFHREMKAGGQFVHPHIVQAYDAGEIGDAWFLAMELVDGLDCEKLARRVGSLPVAEACEIARQAALGLQYAHQSGIVHRDIKPSNLLVGRDGIVKISDLGLAAGVDSGLDFSLTPPGIILGTPDYLSPEHVVREDLIDARSDLYSLGCTLYRLLTARAPFDSAEYDSPMKRALAHVRDEPRDIRSVRNDLSPELVALLHRMTAKDRGARPESAAAVAESLKEPAQGADLASLVGRATVEDAPLEAPALPDVSRQSTVTFMGRTRPVISGGRSRPPKRTALVVAACVAAGSALFLWTGTDILPGRSGAGAGAAAAGAGNGLQNSPENGGERENPRRVVEKGISERHWDLAHGGAPRNTWLALVGHGTPRRLAWPENDFNAALDVQPERDEIRVHCPDLAMIALGEVSQPNYIVQVDLLQTNWVGRIGLFFGHRPLDGEATPAHSVQFLTLERTLMSLDKAQYGLRRARARITPVEGGSRVDLEQIARAAVSAPDRAPQQLEFVVRRGTLESVRWNGQVLKELCSPEIEMEFEPSDYVGQFGLTASASEGSFRNPRILIPE